MQATVLMHLYSLPGLHSVSDCVALAHPCPQGCVHRSRHQSSNICGDSCSYDSRMSIPQLLSLQAQTRKSRCSQMYVELSQFWPSKRSPSHSYVLPSQAAQHASIARFCCHGLIVHMLTLKMLRVLYLNSLCFIGHVEHREHTPAHMCRHMLSL